MSEQNEQGADALRPVGVRQEGAARKQQPWVCNNKRCLRHQEKIPGREIIQLEGKNYCPGCGESDVEIWEALAGPYRCPTEGCRHNLEPINLFREDGRAEHFCPTHQILLVPHFRPSLQLCDDDEADDEGGGSYLSFDPELVAIDWAAN